MSTEEMGPVSCCGLAARDAAQMAPDHPKQARPATSSRADEHAGGAQLIASDSHCQHAHNSALTGNFVNVNKDSHARLG
jgi:hypothetical protein